MMLALDLLLASSPLTIGGQLVVEGPYAFIANDDVEYVAWWTGSVDASHPDYCRTIVRADLVMVRSS